MTAVATRSTGAFLALSCIGAFATAPAGADEAKTPPAAAPDQDRPEIVVNGHRAKPDADPKQVAPLVDTPRSVMVLTSDVIQQTGSTTLQEALRSQNLPFTCRLNRKLGMGSWSLQVSVAPTVAAQQPD